MSPAIAPGIAATCVGAHLTFSFGRDLALGYASRRWLSTQGRIVGWGGHQGSLAAHDSVAALTYKYNVGGRDYTSRRLDYAGGGAGSDAGAVLARYYKGAAVTVWYDPRRPERAVLERGVRFGNYARLLIASSLLVIGLALLSTAVGVLAS